MAGFLIAAVAARASLADEKFVKEGRERNSETKGWLSRALAAIDLRPLPSEANFVMIDVGTDVKPLITSMREKNVRVGVLAHGRDPSALDAHVRPSGRGRSIRFPRDTPRRASRTIGARARSASS